MGARKWHFRILKVQLSPSKSLTITSQKCNFCAQKRRFLATFMRNRQQNRISFHETYHPSRSPFSKIPKIACKDICRKINAFNLKFAPILTIQVPLRVIPHHFLRYQFSLVYSCFISVLSNILQYQQPSIHKVILHYLFCMMDVNVYLLQSLFLFIVSMRTILQVLVFVE